MSGTSQSARFNIAEILTATRGVLLSTSSDFSMLSSTKGAEIIIERATACDSSTDMLAISTDSRSVSRDDLFIPLSGERFDGHDFLESVIAGGARTCLIEKRYLESDKGQWVRNLDLTGLALVVVDNSLDAYHDLARHWLLKVKPFVVGITGSSGKTTTKEMCAASFSKAKKTHKSKANENNEFGVPKTILSMPADTEILILEMAMRGLNQIELLARTSSPHLGIITCVGNAHIELLGTRENIARAKCELLPHIRSGGLAVLGAPDELTRRVAAESYTGRLLEFNSDLLVVDSVTSEGTSFTVDMSSMLNKSKTDSRSSFFIGTHGIEHLQDAWCAIAAALEYGLTPAEIAGGLSTYSDGAGRGMSIELSCGARLVDESYNANPDSMRCAFERFLDRRANSSRHRIAVLGEMAELGPQTESMHEELGLWLKDKELALLITVGPTASLIASAASGAEFTIVAAEGLDEALESVRQNLRSDSTLMIKGSNCAGLSRIVSQLTADLVPG